MPTQNRRFPRLPHYTNVQKKNSSQRLLPVQPHYFECLHSRILHRRRKHWKGFPRLPNPADVMLVTDDSRQTEYRKWRIIGMNAHSYPVFFCHGNHRLQEILQIFAKLCFVNVFIQIQQFSESFNRILIAVNDTSVDKSLGFYYNGIDKFFFSSSVIVPSKAFTLVNSSGV